MRMIATQDYGWSQLAARAGLAWPAAVPWAMERAVQAGFDAWEPFLKTADDAKRVGGLVRAHGLAMPSVFVAGVLFDGAQAGTVMDRIVTMAAEAALFGCEKVMIYPEPHRHGKKTERDLITQARNLERLAQRLSGLTLLYHAEEPEMAERAHEYEHVLTHTDPALVRLCLDPDAAWRGSRLDTPALIELMARHADRTDAIHMRQSQVGVWAEVVGPGDMPLADIAALIRDRDPLVVVEHAYEAATPATLDPVEAHRQSIRFVRSIFSIETAAS